MKTKTDSQDQYQTFQDALKRVIQVSHDELKKQLAAEKRRKRKPKTSVSRASRD